MDSLSVINSGHKPQTLPYYSHETARTFSSDDNIDKIAAILETLSDPSEGRSASYRSDTLSDIKYGLGKVSTVIKIVSAVLTLFGAEAPVDR